MGSQWHGAGAGKFPYMINTMMSHQMFFFFNRVWGEEGGWDVCFVVPKATPLFTSFFFWLHPQPAMKRGLVNFQARFWAYRYILFEWILNTINPALFPTHHSFQECLSTPATTVCCASVSSQNQFRTLKAVDKNDEGSVAQYFWAGRRESVM